MRVLLDTNVLINWLVAQNKKHKEAAKLVLSCLMSEAEGYVTPHSLTDVFYVLRKCHPAAEQRRKFILIMASGFTILAENSDRFYETLNDSNFFDLEDGLQMKCAENANLL